jgi:hypothetical protein
VVRVSSRSERWPVFRSGGISLQASRIVTGDPAPADLFHDGIEELRASQEIPRVHGGSIKGGIAAAPVCLSVRRLSSYRPRLFASSCSCLHLCYCLRSSHPRRFLLDDISDHRPQFGVRKLPPRLNGPRRVRQHLRHYRMVLRCLARVLAAASGLVGAAQRHCRIPSGRRTSANSAPSRRTAHKARHLAVPRRRVWRRGTSGRASRVIATNSRSVVRPVPSIICRDEETTEAANGRAGRSRIRAATRLG